MRRGRARSRWRPAVLLWIPAALGGGAFIALKRSLRDEAAARIPCADETLAPERAMAAP